MISAGVRPVRSCAHRLNRLSLNSLAHPIVHGVDREGTSQALLVPPKRDATGAPFWGQSVSLTASGDRRPRARRIVLQPPFCQDTSDGTVVRYATRRRAHLGLTRLVCPACALPKVAVRGLVHRQVPLAVCFNCV